MMACTDWMFSGILDRFPSIRVAFSEGGAGWVPYLLEQAEDVFRRYPENLATKRSPRHVFAEHMYVCFIRDATAMAAIEVIGEDNITWETDYPHDSGSFPNSRQSLEAMLAGVDEKVAVKIAELNARRLFSI
jgi:predicted TIM-barrel fold metal-dependent hydrolase